MGSRQAKAPCPALDAAALRRMRTLVHDQFSEAEIQLWYKIYRNRSQSRQLTKSLDLTKREFQDVYRGLFSGDAEEFAEHIFRTFDLDGNGRVDFREFLLGLCVSGSTDLETKMKWAFMLYDIDGNGKITWDEMKHIMKLVCNMTSEATVERIETELLARVDPDRLHVHRDPGGEYETRDRAAEIADIFFTEFDQDRDGTVCWDEFRDGALKIPLVVDLLGCGPDV